MPRFIARPVIVEAHQYTGNPMTLEFARAVLRQRQDGGLDIATGDGARHCKLNDWVYRDASGTFWVMPDAPFEAMFEEQRPKRPYTRREVNGQAQV